MRNNVLDYDMRHGYRGPANVLWKVGEGWRGTVKNYRYVESVADLRTAASAVVTSAIRRGDRRLPAVRPFRYMYGVRWARPYRSGYA